TNQQIRSNDYTRPKASPIPDAPPPAAAPKLVTRAAPVPAPAPITAPVPVPDALEALQHDNAQVGDTLIAPGTEDGIGSAALRTVPVSFSPESAHATSQAAATGQIFLQFGAFSAQQTADNLADR